MAWVRWLWQTSTGWRLMAVAALSFVVAGCADQGPVVPKSYRCQPVSADVLANITSTFVAEIPVVVAYQVSSYDPQNRGWIFVTVATGGFPAGVHHVDREFPSPTYAVHAGRLYSADGQAIRYSEGSATPNLSEVPRSPNPLSLGYDEANAASFDCVKEAMRWG